MKSDKEIAACTILNAANCSRARIIKRIEEVFTMDNAQLLEASRKSLPGAFITDQPRERMLYFLCKEAVYDKLDYKLHLT